MMHWPLPVFFIYFSKGPMYRNTTSGLPSPRLLGNVVDKGTTAEGQLIAALGFVVIERFHSPLRLWGKQEEKGQLDDRSRCRKRDLYR